MRAGSLRHRIEIGRYVQGTNDWGDPLPPTWQTIAALWASVEALTGRLYFEARQTAEQSDHQVTIRYREGIEPGMLIRQDGREFTIHAVLDREGTRRWLQLICQEVKPA